MTADGQLFSKYRVSRNDKNGASETDRHYGCDYFVLDMTHDPAALPALSAYAEAIEVTHPTFAADIRRRWLS